MISIAPVSQTPDIPTRVEAEISLDCITLFAFFFLPLRKSPVNGGRA